MLSLTSVEQVFLQIPNSRVSFVRRQANHVAHSFARASRFVILFPIFNIWYEMKYSKCSSLKKKKLTNDKILIQRSPRDWSLVIHYLKKS